MTTKIMAVAKRPRNIFLSSFIKGENSQPISGQVCKYSGFYCDLHLFHPDLDQNFMHTTILKIEAFNFGNS